MSTQDTMLAEALKVLQPTAEAILRSREVDFDDSTYEPFRKILEPAMIPVFSAYAGTDSFISDLRRSAHGRGWTSRQGRAAANVLRREIRGEGGIPCFVCNVRFPNWPELKAHKAREHSHQGAYQPPPEKPVAVLPDYKPEHNIDLRLFPAARYAVEDKTGTLRFIWITELKRRTRLAGRYVWTKFRYANEYLEKGDRTVREQSGDTKKLIGKQRIAQPVYFGEEEDLIKAISENPTEAMTRYGKAMHRCSYCGRSLTDETSRERGIGPDCWEDKHVPYVLRQVRQQAAANGWNAPSGSPVAT